MPRKSKYDWPSLFEEYATSNQSQAQFCKNHGINAKYFSLKKARLAKTAMKSDPFIKVSSTNIHPTPSCVLVIDLIRIEFGSSTPASFVADIAQALT